MKWGLCEHGERYHLLVGGVALCGVPGAIEEPGTDPEWERRCGNCDKAMRVMGRAFKKTRPLKLPAPKRGTTYPPKNRWKE